MEIETTYYDRTMSNGIVDYIQNNLRWLIDYVINNPSLDFQTGHDPKVDRSWFSVYRGTGKIFSIESRHGVVQRPYYADKAYVALLPELFQEPNPVLFDEYLQKIDSDSKFDCYYKCKEDKKEGFYQTLIARRYTIGLKPEDEFVIIDKEFVIGYKDSDTRTRWNKGIVDSLEKRISKLRDDNDSGRLPAEIKSQYGEFDFLALNKRGDLLIMELKQHDPSKTALSPIQTAYYYDQLKKLLQEDPTFYSKVLKMILQKIELGLISSSYKDSLPNNLSGKIIPCVIVGEESDLSDTICDRYRLVRKIFLPEMMAYTCDETGSIVPSLKL